MKKLIAVLFCMSVFCFFSCKSTSSSYSNELTSAVPQPGTFNPDNITFTYIDVATAEVEYDPRVAPQVKKYFVCTLKKAECEQTVMKNSITEAVQPLKYQKDRPGFLKTQVLVGTDARCYYLLALKNDGSVETLSKDIPGETCDDK